MDRFIQSLKGNRPLVWSIVGLALVILFASSLTVWVKRQALDTDSWVSVSTRLLQNDDVRQVVATDLVDAVFANSDAQRRFEEALPERLDPLAAPATGLLRESATSAADTLLQRPGVQSLWADANRQAHERLVAILDGEDDRLVTTGETDVVLDLRPLATQLGQRLGLQVQLAPDVGQITVLRSDQLDAARDSVSTLKRFSLFLALVVLACLAVAVYIGEGFRREVLRVIAFGFIGVAVVLLVLRRIIGDALVGSLTSAATQDAGMAAWIIGTELLREMAFALIVYGLILLVGVVLSGPTRWATAVRRGLAPAMRHHIGAVSAAAGGLVLLSLLWVPGEGSRRLLGVVVLAALVGCGIEALRRQILREVPADGS